MKNEYIKIDEFITHEIYASMLNAIILNGEGDLVEKIRKLNAKVIAQSVSLNDVKKVMG